MMKKLALLLIILLLPIIALAQTYTLPTSRSIPWLAGTDLWNGGSIPSYTPVTCTGLAGNGTTDDGPAIQSCITALSTNQCALVPAGTYLINSTVRVKSQTCLTGAKAEGGPPFLPATDATATRLKLGTSGWLTSQNFSSSSGNLTPASPFGVLPSSFCFITGSPQKGDTSFTSASLSGGCALSVGSWVEIYGNDDPSLITVTGANGHCNWCGNNNGQMVAQQIVQVTSVTGSVIGISRPWYLTPYTSAVTGLVDKNGSAVTQPAGAKYTVITFPTQKAGFQNLRIDGSTVDMTNQLILLQGCLYCWVSNVNTYGAGDHSGAVHVELDYTYGAEIRDSAFIGQTGATGSSNVNNNTAGASGSGYGVYFQFTNSDAKVENNIFQGNRHWIVYQGGGSGTAILYNYASDGYTDDLAYLASGRTSHGAHPFENLLEGNVTAHVTADDYWGTSSHLTFFRNWLWASEANTTQPGCTGTPTQPLPQCSVPLFPPNESFNPIDLYYGQSNYNFVGNVLGAKSPVLTLSLQPNWASGTLRGFDEYSPLSTPVVYSMAPATGSLPSSDGTSLNHGNYDFKTMGVAYWEGGANHTLPSSLYYSSEPAFMTASNCTWPSIGPDITPVATVGMPAYARYSNTPCSGAPAVGNIIRPGTTITAGTVLH